MRRHRGLGAIRVARHAARILVPIALVIVAIVVVGSLYLMLQWALGVGTGH